MSLGSKLKESIPLSKGTSLLTSSDLLFCSSEVAILLDVNELLPLLELPSESCLLTQRNVEVCCYHVYLSVSG